jgi:hypothetical protein
MRKNIRGETKYVKIRSWKTNRAIAVIKLIEESPDTSE